MDPNTPNKPTQPNQPSDPNRTQGATIGEGLQESRLNTEFIDFLKKYGDRALFVVLLIVVAYVAWGWWQDQQLDALDRAFADLDSAQSASLLSIAASEHPGKGSVPVLAQARAAAIELSEARRGYPQTVDLLVATDEDRLSEEDRNKLRRSALGRLVIVKNQARNNPALAPLLYRAHWDSATAHIDLGEFDQAKSELEAARAVAEQMTSQTSIDLANRRIAELDSIRRARPPVETLAIAPTPAPDQPADEGVFDPSLFEVPTKDADPGPE